MAQGQAVTAGEVIGYVGTTGSSTGNHLHFEVRVNESRMRPHLHFSVSRDGAVIDPHDYVNGGE